MSISLNEDQDCVGKSSRMPTISMKVYQNIILHVSSGEITIVHAPQHLLHSGQVEFLNQELIPSFEAPERMGLILSALAQRGLLAPMTEHHGKTDICLAHDWEYIASLAKLCAALPAQGPAALPSTWPGPNAHVTSNHPIGVQLGRWCRDMFTSVGAGTFKAAAASVCSVTFALESLLLRGEGGAFALSRPPHHHAGKSYMNGYCYLNGVATAAMMARRAGLKVAVIDVDYHHGNGTQDILYDMDILFCSLHGDPRSNFPFFHGYADEIGAGAGTGFTMNVPLPDGCDWQQYAAALKAVINRVQAYGPDILIVSLGVDTFAGDPVAKFTFRGDDFLSLGQALSAVRAPTLFVMEGGYAVAEIGTNVANVLEGWLGR